MQISSRNFAIQLFLFLILSIFVDCIINCYDCHGSINMCTERRPMKTCPDDKPYCMFSWNRRTGMAAQGCADVNICGNPRWKRGLYYPYPEERYESLPNTNEMNNCCNYDYCNCLGGQCKPIMMVAHASKLACSFSVLAISIGMFLTFV